MVRGTMRGISHLRLGCAGALWTDLKALRTDLKGELIAFLRIGRVPLGGVNPEARLP